MTMHRTTISLFSCLIALALFGGIAHFVDAGGAGTGTQWVGTPYQNASLGTYQPTTNVSGNATWSTTLNDVSLAYAWNRWTLAQSKPECFSGQSGNFSSDTVNSTCVSGFVTAGSDINVQISQEARVYDATTGAVIANNATLTPGQQVRLEFKRLVPENIFWFATGYSLDSPYGEWRTNATAPARVNSSNGGVSSNHVTCNIRDYTNSIRIDDYSRHTGCMVKLKNDAAAQGPMWACKTYGTDGSGNQVCDEYWYYHFSAGFMDETTADNFCRANGYGPQGQYDFDVYAPLEVNPPARTFSYGGLTGCVSAPADSDSDLAVLCTVPDTQGATLTPTFNYGATYGYFYYRYYDYRNMNYSSQGPPYGYNYGAAGCYGNNIPLYKIRDSVIDAPGYNPVDSRGLYIGDVESSPYRLTVPAMNVPFTFTVATLNAAPTAPVITGPTSGTVATNHTFTFTSTDPDSDTIRYGIDWNNDGTLDQWVPASGYVVSGTAQSAIRQWASTGPVTFQALAQDSKGLSSGWTPHTITVTSAPPNLTAGAVSPTSTTVGTAVTLSATITNTGTGATSAGFTSLFQRATSAAGANATDIGTDTSPVLGASGTDVTQTSYTFPTATTWYVRACADKSSAANTGAITETNEGDNCGAWTAIIVATPTVSCTVDDTSVNTGDSVTYTAVSSGGASGNHTWTASDGGSYGTGSTVTRSFPVAGPYDMRVKRANTAEVSCPRVDVGDVCINPALDITATPDRVQAGSSVTINWTGSGLATSCTVTGTNGYTSGTITPATCGVSGSTNATITTQTTFTIACGGTTDTVIVNVIPKFEEF